MPTLILIRVRLRIIIEPETAHHESRQRLARLLLGLIYPGQQLFKFIRQSLDRDYEPKRIADALKLTVGEQGDCYISFALCHTMATKGGWCWCLRLGAIDTGSSHGLHLGDKGSF